MRRDKEKAIKLRLQGLSYSEINRRLNVPKSTLSLWLRDIQLSHTAQKRIQERHREKSLKGLIQRNKKQTHEARMRAQEQNKQGKQLVKNINKRELTLIAAALYWGEGYKRPIIKNGVIKTQHSLALSNADPVLIKVFIDFLQHVCGVNTTEITAELRIFQHINKQKSLEFWAQHTGIPIENFRHFYYGISKSSQHKKPYNRLPYGSIQIRLNNTQLFHKVMGIIEGIKENVYPR